MSIENASRFVTEAHARDRKVLALIPGGMVPDAIGSEEFAAVAKAAQDAGWDFTADELQEAYLDSLEMTELDEDEFAAVAGGNSYRCYDNTENEGNGSSGRGGCTSNYYAEECRATVEPGSVCNCNDYKEDDYTKC